MPLCHARDVFLTDGNRVSAATVASTAIAAAQWAVTQVTCLNDKQEVCNISLLSNCLWLYFFLFYASVLATAVARGIISFRLSIRASVPTTTITITTGTDIHLDF